MNADLHRQLDAIEERLSRPSEKSDIDLAQWCDRLYGRSPDTLPVAPSASSPPPTNRPEAEALVEPRGWWDGRGVLRWAQVPYRRPVDKQGWQATQTLLRRAWLWAYLPPLGSYGVYLLFGFMGLLATVFVAAHAPPRWPAVALVATLVTLGLGTLWKRWFSALRCLHQREEQYQKAWVYEDELSRWLRWPALAQEVERVLQQTTATGVPLLEGDRQILARRAKQLERQDQAQRVMDRVSAAARRS